MFPFFCPFIDSLQKIAIFVQAKWRNNKNFPYFWSTQNHNRAAGSNFSSADFDVCFVRIRFGLLPDDETEKMTLISPKYDFRIAKTAQMDGSVLGLLWAFNGPHLGL